MERLLIFIDENDDLVTGFEISGFDDGLKSGSRVREISGFAINALPFGKVSAEFLLKIRDGCVPAACQVQMQHRMRGPVFLQCLHRKSFEKLLSSAEIGLHC